jgi:hypothetical protein
LNSNAAKTSGNDFMNGTRPTSSVFSLGNGNGCNKSSDNVIAYCWSEVSGFSKFSSFSGTGSSGNAVTTGFKPRLVLLKRTDTTGNWFIFDSERGTGGTVWADLSDAEESNYSITLRNDGFNVNGSAAGMNASGGTYIYAAFASKPSGEEIDSLFDVPTNGTQSDTGAGGEVSGNHATLNPLSSGSGVTLSNGNLDMANSSSGSTRVAFSSIGMSAGKYYCEFTCVSGDYAIGLADGSFAQGQYVGLDSTHYSYFQNGKKYNGGSNQTYGSSFTDGDVIGIAFDADAGNLYFYKNGTVQNSGTAAFTGLTNGPYFFAFGDASMNGSVNFGQRAFKYGNAGTNRPAATYKTLCTTNLPTPTIADGSDYFDTKLYTGNGTSQTISGLSFSPDWVWTKLRSAGFGHRVWDTVRGATKRLAPHDTGAEATESTALTAFTSDGFSVGSEANVNTTHLGGAFVAWCWDAGSSTASNTDGSITSSVRASAASGFSIVSYTGNGTAGATIGHGLNAAPELILLKSRDTQTSNQSWTVHHSAIPATKNLILNDTAAAGTTGSWNDTAPGSSVFTVGSAQVVNTSSKKYIAYCFAPVSGFSAFGQMTGNASNDGPFQFTGFRVKWLMVKGSDYASNWNIVDATRNEFNETDKVLRANLSNAEVDGSAQGNFAMGFDFLSNGFKVRRSGVDVNKSGGTLIWAAFAENPFQANGGLAR